MEYADYYSLLKQCSHSHKIEDEMLLAFKKILDENKTLADKGFSSKTDFIKGRDAFMRKAFK